MIIAVDPRSHLPPFEQVRAQIRTLIGTGELPTGYRLPPVRRLAADLRLAPNTVARAYRELEQEGLLRSRGARGTFVAPPPARPSASPEPGAAAPDLRMPVRALVQHARLAGVDRAALLSLVAAEWDGTASTAVSTVELQQW